MHLFKGLATKAMFFFFGKGYVRKENWNHGLLGNSRTFRDCPREHLGISSDNTGFNTDYRRALSVPTMPKGLL